MLSISIVATAFNIAPRWALSAIRELPSYQIQIFQGLALAMLIEMYAIQTLNAAGWTLIHFLVQQIPIRMHDPDHLYPKRCITSAMNKVDRWILDMLLLWVNKSENPCDKSKSIVQQ